MPRKPLPQQEYIIQKQEHGPSKAAKTLGQYMVTITFRGSIDKRNYVTYIVENFRNLKQWEDVLLRPHDKLRIQFDPGWISYGNTIDADSRPFIVEDAVVVIPAIKPRQSLVSENVKIMQGLILTYKQYGCAPAVLASAEQRLAELLHELENAL